MSFNGDLDQLMKKHGMLFVLEEGGDILPYRRAYYDPKSGTGIEVLDVEDTSSLREALGDG